MGQANGTLSQAMKIMKLTTQLGIIEQISNKIMSSIIVHAIILP